MQVASATIITAGLAVGLVALVVLHALPTGLSPLRNAVSQYGISQYRAGYRVQTLAYASAGFGAAIGIATLPGSAGIVVALCVVFAASRAVISWFPMDAPGAAPTRTGIRHGMLALAAFLAVGFACRQLVTLLHRDGIDPGIAAADRVLALLMAISLIAMALGRRRKYFGGAERLFYLCMTAWLTSVAVLVCLPR